LGQCAGHTSLFEIDFGSHFGLLLNFQSENSSKFNVSHTFNSKTQEINSMKPFSFNVVFQQYKEHASICLNNFSLYFNDEIVQSLITIAHSSKHYEITLLHTYLSKGFPMLPNTCATGCCLEGINVTKQNKWSWKAIMYNTFMSIDGMRMSLFVFICVEVNVYTYVCIYMDVCVRVHPP